MTPPGGAGFAAGALVDYTLDMSATPGRAGRIDYLRLSITDRCNLRCTYCMPPEGVPPRPHDDILTYEELHAFTRAAVDFGVS